MKGRGTLCSRSTRNLKLEEVLDVPGRYAPRAMSDRWSAKDGGWGDYAAAVDVGIEQRRVDEALNGNEMPNSHGLSLAHAAGNLTGITLAP